AACDLVPEVFHNVDKPGPRVFALVLGVLAAGVFPHHATEDLESGLFFELMFASWDVFVSMAPYLLFGFILAGFISQWLDADKLSKWIRGNDAKSVGIASVLGAPLPLCSCSVVPVAASLRKAGASKGATSAFLVSTPETGVDSVVVTYGMLDPVMTVIRPLASVLSAFLTGLSVNMFVKSGADDEPLVGRSEEPPAHCCSDGEDEVHSHETSKQGGLVRRALRFAFVDMLDDLTGALFVGVLLSGVITVLIPDSAFDSSLLQGHWSLFLMLLIGVPIYVCAASSTPIAATLILKGLSPGAALVFLLAGPATNLATLSVMTKYLGKRVALVHILVLSLVTLVLGYVTNAIYLGLGVTATASAGEHDHGERSNFMLVAAVVFGLLMLNSLWRQFAKSDAAESCSDHSHD
ncbi:MAG: uncharacterized membrane protein YraQ (UPF0718 family), partial [Candidatus Paceibacteria bacterium]